MAGGIAMASHDYSHLLVGSSSGPMEAGPQAVTLQPVFIPRQPNSGVPFQQPSSPPGGVSSASADWAFLLRSAAALSRGGNQSAADNAMMGGSSPNNIVQQGQQGVDMTGRSPSPQQPLSSPGNILLNSAGPGGGAGQQASTSASGLFAGNGSLMHLDSLGAFSADALAASAAGDPSNSFVMLSNSSLPPTLSGMYGDSSGIQTLYGSNDAATVASAAAAAAVARASTAQSLLQQQAAAAVSNASLANSLGGQGLTGLTSNLSLTGLGNKTLEESLSGSLFGPGGTPATLSPKPVSASLYIKNLPADADKLFLYEKFSPYGAILSVKVLNDPQSGQCRGVGFVNFAEHTSAVRSIQALHGTKVGDKLLHVSLQTPRLRAAAMQVQNM